MQGRKISPSLRDNMRPKVSQELPKTHLPRNAAVLSSLIFLLPKRGKNQTDFKHDACERTHLNHIQNRLCVEGQYWVLDANT
jgi:hypothetical protein